MTRVVVGMSGGVDSSVVAAMLKEQGHEVTGVFIEAYNEPGCRTDQDKKDALQAALKIDIPFKVLDLRKEYKEKVVEYFFASYRSGKTPNPDVVCNRDVKFGLFFDWARKNDFEQVATGHYARIAQLQGTEPCKYLQRAVDSSKDQSYFLWQVKTANLARIRFPLGEMKKQDVRKKARELGLTNADKPDSMGVCMMGELNVKEFLKRQLGENPGEVILQGTEPCKIGRHRGLWFHTIGQRGGIDIDKKLLKNLGYQPESMEPLYVIGKNVTTNTLTVGSKDAATRASFALNPYELRVKKLEIENWVAQRRLFVRIRNLGELNVVTKCRVRDNSSLQIELSKPIFGVAEGQSCVLYLQNGERGNEIVVGGGETCT